MSFDFTVTVVLVQYLPYNCNDPLTTPSRPCTWIVRIIENKPETCFETLVLTSPLRTTLTSGFYSLAAKLVHLALLAFNFVLTLVFIGITVCSSPTMNA